MFSNLEKAIKALEGYVKSPQIIEGKEEFYYIVQANQTINPKHANLPDENYMVCSGSYLKIMQEHWGDKKEIKQLAKAQVLRQ